MQTGLAMIWLSRDNSPTLELKTGFAATGSEPGRDETGFALSSLRLSPRVQIRSSTAKPVFKYREWDDFAACDAEQMFFINTGRVLFPKQNLALTKHEYV
jgi:hypothetical protein